MHKRTILVGLRKITAFSCGLWPCLGDRGAACNTSLARAKQSNMIPSSPTELSMMPFCKGSCSEFTRGKKVDGTTFKVEAPSKSSQTHGSCTINETRQVCLSLRNTVSRLERPGEHPQRPRSSHLQMLQYQHPCQSHHRCIPRPAFSGRTRKRGQTCFDMFRHMFNHKRSQKETNTSVIFIDKGCRNTTIVSPSARYAQLPSIDFIRNLCSMPKKLLCDQAK